MYKAHINKTFLFTLLSVPAIAIGLLGSVSVAAAKTSATLVVPQAVAVGSPFLVELSSPGKLEAVEIEWSERFIRPSIAHTEDTYNALTLLGTGMNAEPGVRSIQVRARVAGRNRTYQKFVDILPKDFPQEALSVAPQMNKPPKEIHGRIKRELAAMRGALRTDSPQRLWEIPFHRPVPGIMLSRFGLRRTFNNETKRRHTGLDFRAPEGTPIEAVAAGKVVLVGEYYLPGNTVVIDHGNGVVSMAMHMSKVMVKVGEWVERGQAYGRSGATGRVTGAHLHLSIAVHGVTVDPEPLFEIDGLTGVAASLQSE